MRLRRPEAFRRVWAAGRSWAHPLLVLWALPNDLECTRVGITASRKVGNAVERNRARRLLREAIRQLYAHIAPGWDIVLVARGPLVAEKVPRVLIGLRQLLERAQLWDEVQEMDT